MKSVIYKKIEVASTVGLTAALNTQVDVDVKRLILKHIYGLVLNRIDNQIASKLRVNLPLVLLGRPK